ncbi:helix-turn-helix transcriptional regulator [Pseudalkalibacillus caeni]|uniref:YafY family transcriptional regulator n=1 Tax=Exobacillus caeni TaxID=2574798 RepID=A0A5R9F098_9BACL|nr:YafY family protein [Pseudalkalibacillus caeni]TLS36119.1 YafY family transcriptional regulator [Pseudalkalibacillus caeni]
MSKTKRLINLMILIHDRKKFNVAELAEEFGVSYRTILRDLEELSSLGVPLYSETGAGGGYFLLHEKFLPPIVFSEEEAIAMFFAYQSLQFYGALPFEAESKAALKKFYHHLPNETKKQIDEMKERIVLWNPHRIDSQSPALLKTLLKAATTKSTVEISYRSFNGVHSRIISPVGLYSYNGYWFCPAYCHKREAYRLFRADRIEAAEFKEHHQLPPTNKITLKDWLQPYRKTEEYALKLIVKLDREGIRRGKSELDLEYLIEEDKDGTGKINTTIPETEASYFAEILWGLGNHVKVQEPVEIIDIFKEKLEDMASLYSEELRNV